MGMIEQNFHLNVSLPTRATSVLKAVRLAMTFDECVGDLICHKRECLS